MPETETVRWSSLRFAAWLSLAIHAIAGVAMATVLRYGLGSNADFSGRVAFLVEHQRLWVLGWLTWNAAALAILYFFLSFARAHQASSAASAAMLQFGVLLSAAGVAADLSAETIEMAIIPEIASKLSDDPDNQPAKELLTTLDRTAVVLTGYLANGLYSIAALLLTCSTVRSYAAWIWISGFAVAASGLSLSATALMGSVAGMIYSNIILVPCILLWQAGIALDAGKRIRKMSSSPSADSTEI